MGWVCWWFSLLLLEVFLQVLRFCPFLKFKFKFKFNFDLEHEDTFERTTKNEALSASREIKLRVFFGEIELLKTWYDNSIATSNVLNSEVIAIFNKIIPDTLCKFFYENKELHEY